MVTDNFHICPGCGTKFCPRYDEDAANLKEEQVMKKMIIIVDAPETCFYCKFRQGVSCSVFGFDVTTEIELRMRPPKCCELDREITVD